ncbi:unnamed protein product [Symbiodinium natans]|uniref:Uncharacterized protein n=1 Tax=Symbiodinium natans TaxID=878477 RepID=A0A812UVS5_9DINO|nr:unnamed protein product [Symbiodinium natans]
MPTEPPGKMFSIWLQSALFTVQQKDQAAPETRTLEDSQTVRVVRNPPGTNARAISVHCSQSTEEPPLKPCDAWRKPSKLHCAEAFIHLGLASSRRQLQQSHKASRLEFYGTVRRFKSLRSCSGKAQYCRLQLEKCQSVVKCIQVTPQVFVCSFADSAVASVHDLLTAHTLCRLSCTPGLN